VTSEKPAPSEHQARRMVIGGDGNELQLPVEERTGQDGQLLVDGSGPSGQSGRSGELTFLSGRLVASRC
jgi:hypothetical protein